MALSVAVVSPNGPTAGSWQSRILFYSNGNMCVCKFLRLILSRVKYFKKYTNWRFFIEVTIVFVKLRWLVGDVFLSCGSVWCLANKKTRSILFPCLDRGKDLTKSAQRTSKGSSTGRVSIFPACFCWEALILLLWLVLGRGYASAVDRAMRWR